MTMVQHVGVSAIYVAGDYLELVVSIQDGDGSPFDLTGIQGARYAIVPYPGAATPLLTKSLGAGITVTDEGGGVMTIALDNGDTDGMQGKFNHELEITDSGDRISTVMIGEFHVTAQSLV